MCRRLSLDVSVGSYDLKWRRLIRSNILKLQDVLEDLVLKQAEVNYVIDDGNRLLDDQTCSVDEKKDIHEKMSRLYTDWDKLSVSLTSRQER